MQIVIGGGYGKTTGLSGKDTHTLHMFPKSVEELLLTHLAWVHSFQARFVPIVMKNYDPNFLDYLWSSKGKVWTAAKFSYILRQKTREITSTGAGFGLHDVRHISSGINDHYDLKRHDTADHVADLSSGHKTMTAEARYAVTPQQDQSYSQAYIYNCQDFFKKLHYFFGFDRNTLQLRSEKDLWAISRGMESENEVLFVLKNIQEEMQKLTAQQELQAKHLDEIVTAQLKLLLVQNQTSGGGGSDTPLGGNFPQPQLPYLTPTKIHTHLDSMQQSGVGPGSISMATPSPRARVVGRKSMETRKDVAKNLKVPNQARGISAIVELADNPDNCASTPFGGAIEVVQSVLQKSGQSVVGRTAAQRLENALKLVPKTMSLSEATCCECGETFKAGERDAVELLTRHFLTKTIDAGFRETHWLRVKLYLPLVKGKSATYHRMDSHGNFGFICDAPSCVKHFGNISALKEHIVALSTEQSKQHARYSFLGYARKAAPYHHLGTTRVDFELQDMDSL